MKRKNIMVPEEVKRILFSGVNTLHEVSKLYENTPLANETCAECVGATYLIIKLGLYEEYEKYLENAE